jgi:hypothetical protein
VLMIPGGAAARAASSSTVDKMALEQLQTNFVRMSVLDAPPRADTSGGIQEEKKAGEKAGEKEKEKEEEKEEEKAEEMAHGEDVDKEATQHDSTPQSSPLPEFGHAL